MHPEWAQIVDSAWKYGRKWDIPADLVLAIIHRESNFDRMAVSNAGAYGLMQVRYSVWGTELGLSQLDLEDIDKNIDAGCQILRGYYDETGNWGSALLRYNNGYKIRNWEYGNDVMNSKFYRMPR
jgi:soluble lytic murein transglycosylase-like protein